MVSVDGLGELVECWWDLKSLEQDSLLSLEEDIFGPANKSGHISSGLDITTNSEVSGSLLEEGVSVGLGSLGALSGLLELLWRL